MPKFSGLPEGDIKFIPVPAIVVSELLPQIDHLGELKLTIYVFWLMEHQEGAFRYLRKSDLFEDKILMESLSTSPGKAVEVLEESLERAVERGTLLQAEIEIDGKYETLYFVNSPKGRSAVEAVQNGQWHVTGDSQMPIHIKGEPPNSFKLYEHNIGPLTPMIAEALGEAEATYPRQWIEDAIRIAVERNKRSWRYAEAILERWQREGRDAQKEELKDRRDSEETRRRYVEGEYSDFVEH